ncbi:MAG: anti-sigma factor [Planctomycetota bacterium]|nr:anti-sigma factor [Planctomycetota bacterium]
MGCERTRDRLGAYLDGELSAEDRRVVEAHVAECAGCQAELKTEHAIAAELSIPTSAKVPDGLWEAIEDELDAQRRAQPSENPVRPGLRRFAIAAGIILAAVAGTALFARSERGAGEAQASSINFDVLLDSISFDPDKALKKFLVLYGAKEIRAFQVSDYASDLNFALPDLLPGGFRLLRVYGLRFGDGVGLAARYARGEEFLAVLVHPAVYKEDYGTRKDHSCVIGKHRGQKTCVGPWSLVHVTDSTTCHCVLSRLGDSPELAPILEAVAPSSADAYAQHHDVGDGH